MYCILTMLERGRNSINNKSEAPQSCLETNKTRNTRTSISVLFSLRILTKNAESNDITLKHLTINQYFSIIPLFSATLNFHTLTYITTCQNGSNKVNNFYPFSRHGDIGQIGHIYISGLEQISSRWISRTLFSSLRYLILYK